MPFRSRSFSLPGATHSVNEDCCSADDACGLYVLADGVGRYRGAAVASRIAVDAALGVLAAPVPPDTVARRQWLVQAARQAIRGMTEEAVRTPAHKDMHATLTAVRLAAGELLCLHIGDCRLYRFRAGQLEQLTADHTVAWEQFERGAISKEQLRTHPNQKLLTRLLGPLGLPVADIRFDTLAGGDRLLLCSDGLIKALDDAVLAAAFSATGEAAALVTDLQARLGTAPLGDDTTAIAVDVVTEA